MKFVELNHKAFTKISSLFLILVLLTSMTLFFTPIFAEGIATIWTTDEFGNPKQDFAPFTTVFIHGENFEAEQETNISITKPDNSIDVDLTVTDSLGAFVYPYFLSEGIEGIYYAIAEDGTNSAETVFTDAVIDFSQCANDSDNDNIQDDCEWVGGNLNQNNAIYPEGSVVPQRLFHKISTAGIHTMTLNYHFTKSSKYAYDFLSSPDLTQSGTDFNPCGQLPVWISLAECNALFSGAITALIPSDSFDNVSTRENPAIRNFLIGGATSPTITIIGHNPATSCFQNCGDSDVTVDVTFTTTAPDTLVVLWYGGHVAQSTDPDGNGPLEGWGDGFGASSISGSPYHQKYIALDGSSVGNRDNQMQSDAVLPPECLVDADCDDGLYCNGPETCNPSNLTCEPGIPPSCDDSVACTIDSCNETTDSCDNLPDNTACDDGFYCTGTETCDVTLGCVPGTPIDCSHLSDQCNNGACDEAQDTCVAEPLPENTVCEADSSLCTIDQCNAFGECVLSSEVDCSLLDGACQTGICEPSDGLCYPDYSNFPLSTPCEADGDLCTIDHCNGIGTCIQFDFVDCSLMDDQCNIGQCDPGSGNCFKAPLPDQTLCDDGLWCNVGEVCISGQCTNGSVKDCSGFDISQISTCFNDPDLIDFTWDFRQAFTSVCDEQNDVCTTGNETITHDCSIASCSAECEQNNTSQCTDLEECIGVKSHSRIVLGCTAGCLCDYGDWSSLVCDKDCGAECEISSDCAPKCINDVYYFNGTCELDCGCDYESHDCSQDSGWYDTGNTQWISTGQCTEKEQKEQEYREYSCGAQGCDYTITGTQWIDTGNTRGKPLSTPCDNGTYCDGEDHCDGFGLCVPLGQAVDCSHLTEQCGIGFCNENIDSCDFEPAPISTPCEADGDLCTIDHCNGIGTCIQFDFVDCSLMDDQCNIGQCEPLTGICFPAPVPNETPCDDGLYCNTGEICIAGVCANGAPRDCSQFDLPPVGECGYFPDGNPVTWDYFIGFDSVCDEALDKCTEGIEEVESRCEKDCGAECEEDQDCATELINDVCYYNGACNLEPGCDCFFDEEQCPAPGTIIDGYCYWGERTCTDLDGCGINKDSMDCYLECDPVTGPGVLPALATEKTVVIPDGCALGPDGITCFGGNAIECGYFGDQNEASECWFVRNPVLFELNALFEGVGEVSTFYRVRWKEDYNSDWGQWSEWFEYAEPIAFEEDSIHELEYYSYEPVCEIEEEHKFEIDIVEHQAPVPIKTVGEPKEECVDLACDFNITMSTPITLECEDQEPHPSGNEEVCYRYYWDDLLVQDWICEEEPVTVFFEEECMHQLDFYCKDELGNTSEIDSEKFKVEGTAIRIPLYKKWNLISVPFVLKHSNPEKLFEDLNESIESVWSYNAVLEKWFVWRPGKPDTSNLASIEPGYGYWVGFIDDFGELLLGGNLFSPAKTPVSKPLKEGWNLIGYYGTGWQEYQGELSCFGEETCYGKEVFCSLWSLVSGVYPEWSALYSYMNNGQHNADWVSLNVCGENNKMHVGKGYWIFLDRAQYYSPSSFCLWDEDMVCEGDIT